VSACNATTDCPGGARLTAQRLTRLAAQHAPSLLAARQRDLLLRRMSAAQFEEAKQCGSVSGRHARDVWKAWSVPRIRNLWRASRGISTAGGLRPGGALTGSSVEQSRECNARRRGAAGAGSWWFFWCFFLCFFKFFNGKTAQDPGRRSVVRGAAVAAGAEGAAGGPAPRSAAAAAGRHSQWHACWCGTQSWPATPSRARAPAPCSRRRGWGTASLAAGPEVQHSLPSQPVCWGPVFVENVLP
jgi:hypothetical protein